MKNIAQRTPSQEVSISEIGHHIGQTVRIHGSVYKIRRMRGFAFVILRARREMIQCVYSPEFSNFDLENLKEESSIRLTAFVAEEPRSRTGWELQMQKVEVLSSPAEIPPVVINQKEVVTSMESLLDYRPITLRNERQRAIFKIQEGLCHGIRRFLEKEDFTEVHTPKIVFAGAEGGANLFKLGYFGKEAYLAQSPQFYKQMMVGVFERVFEIGPVFRAEKHDTSRHLNEYTSVDLEMGYIESFEEIMALETEMLRSALEYLKENCAEETSLLQVKLPPIQSIPAVTFREAKEMVSKAYQRKIKDWEDMEPEEERLLSELIEKQTGSDFVFITHYPSAKRPFYAMDCPENPMETRSFDLLFRGLEITTGGQRIHDYKQQICKMKKRNMQVEAFESYLQMHRYGMPPHGGLGLGLERLTARLLGFDNVRFATLFPRDTHRLVP